MNSHHGLILGRDRETGELIRHAGEAHAMTFAATGKGKTVGPVITNARTYPGQFIAIDVKGEIYAQSVDYRRQFGPVHAIDLSDELVAEDRLNPFDITRRMGKGLETTSRSMAQSIASPPSVSRNHDQFWANHSISLIEAGAIHLLKDVPEDATPWKLHSLYQGDDVVYSTARSGLTA